MHHDMHDTRCWTFGSLHALLTRVSQVHLKPQPFSISRVTGSLFMAASNSVETTKQHGQWSSSDPELHTRRDDLADPDETTPLLRTNHPLGNHSGWLSSARSVVTVSAFFDRNAGLLLVAASQSFFTAMNFSVKWLNSLDEPIPLLEVCVSSRVLFSGLTSFRAANMGQNGEYLDLSSCI
jgi:hypothetical protein